MENTTGALQQMLHDKAKKSLEKDIIKFKEFLGGETGRKFKEVLRKFNVNAGTLEKPNMQNIYNFLYYDSFSKAAMQELLSTYEGWETSAFLNKVESLQEQIDELKLGKEE